MQALIGLRCKSHHRIIWIWIICDVIKLKLEVCGVVTDIVFVQLQLCSFLPRDLTLGIRFHFPWQLVVQNTCEYVIAFSKSPQPIILNCCQLWYNYEFQLNQATCHDATNAVNAQNAGMDLICFLTKCSWIPVMKRKVRYCSPLINRM